MNVPAARIQGGTFLCIMILNQISREVYDTNNIIKSLWKLCCLCLSASHSSCRHDAHSPCTCRQMDKKKKNAFNNLSSFLNLCTTETLAGFYHVGSLFVQEGAELIFISSMRPIWKLDDQIVTVGNTLMAFPMLDCDIRIFFSPWNISFLSFLCWACYFEAHSKARRTLTVGF